MRILGFLFIHEDDDEWENTREKKEENARSSHFSPCLFAQDKSQMLETPAISSDNSTLLDITMALKGQVKIGPWVGGQEEMGHRA